VPDYAQEDGVDPERSTETFAEIVLEIESVRWASTRFLLRAGKALARRRKEAVVRFRSVRHQPFGYSSAELAANVLQIGLDGPDDLALHLTGSVIGPPPHLTPLTLTAPPLSSELPAYAHVLLDILGGGSALSVRGDKAKVDWGVVTPVLQAWAAGLVPLLEYQAGSAGPPPLVDTSRRAG
jgi:glucose-6-phosphate 1-dehydrogenase